MTEPFSHDAFNFTKVKEPEVLAKYYVDKGKVCFVDKSTSENPEGVSVLYTILLNGSFSVILSRSVPHLQQPPSHHSQPVGVLSPNLAIRAHRGLTDHVRQFGAR